MIQLLLHLFGDFITQNNWMAENKSKMTLNGYVACFTHCALYSIPFAFIASPAALMVIFGTHFFIDKFRLARHVCRIKNWTFNTETGYSEHTPAWLSTLLVMVVDNTMHITINYLALRCL
jgi:hypothetical protein